jgi:hypothetical protein
MIRVYFANSGSLAPEYAGSTWESGDVPDHHAAIVSGAATLYMDGGATALLQTNLTVNSDCDLIDAVMNGMYLR